MSQVADVEKREKVAGMESDSEGSELETTTQ